MDKISKKMKKQIKALQKQLDVAINDASTNGHVAKSAAGDNVAFYIDAIDRLVRMRAYLK